MSKHKYALYSGNFVISNIDFTNKKLYLKYINYYYTIAYEKKEDILLVDKKKASLLRDYLYHHFDSFMLEKTGVQENTKYSDNINNEFYLQIIRNA